MDFSIHYSCKLLMVTNSIFLPVHAEVGLELLLQARVDWPTVSQPHIINGLLRPPNSIILAQLQAAPVNKFVGQPKDVGESVIVYHLVPWSHGVSLCLLESLHRSMQLSSLLPSPQEEGVCKQQFAGHLKNALELLQLLQPVAAWIVAGAYP